MAENETPTADDRVDIEPVAEEDTSADSINTDTPEFDEAQEKGYFGERPDPAPESAYTVEGVTSGEPTPETDADLRAEAVKNVAGDVKGRIF